MDQTVTARPIFVSVQKIIALFTVASLIIMLGTVSFIYTRYKPNIKQQKKNNSLAQSIKW